jgi:hypothetical protein
MLKSDQNQKLVAITTLEKGQTALESLESELAAQQFKFGLQAAEKWVGVLESKIQEFSTAGNVSAVENSLTSCHSRLPQ